MDFHIWVEQKGRKNKKGEKLFRCSRETCRHAVWSSSDPKPSPCHNPEIHAQLLAQRDELMGDGCSGCGDPNYKSKRDEKSRPVPADYPGHDPSLS